MRLIDADALFKEFGRTAWYNNADRDAIAEEILSQMPTIDAVPVVRCKDCKHRGSDMCPMETVELYPWFGSKNDAFCSYGERRSDE